MQAYASLEQYKASLAEARDPKNPDGTVKTPTEERPKIRLLIIDIDLIPQKPLQWISDLQKMTKDLAPLLVDTPPLVLMMAYDGGTYRLDSFQNDAIDDLLLKPIDKALFLQKLEFLTAETGKLSPSFLFRAKASRIIEIGRDVMVDEISEFSAAIRSPGPVPEGAFASHSLRCFRRKRGSTPDRSCVRKSAPSSS